jgi:hypothetical protein
VRDSRCAQHTPWRARASRKRNVCSQRQSTGLHPKAQLATLTALSACLPAQVLLTVALNWCRTDQGPESTMSLQAPRAAQLSRWRPAPRRGEPRRPCQALVSTMSPEACRTTALPSLLPHGGQRSSRTVTHPAPAPTQPKSGVTRSPFPSLYPLCNPPPSSSTGTCSNVSTLRMLQRASCEQGALWRPCILNRAEAA